VIERSTLRPSYIVVGTSAGGLGALSRIFKDLPGDLPAAVLVVMHVSRVVRSVLSEHLMHVGQLPMKEAEPGEPIRQGMAYIAPLDRHLIIQKGYFGEGDGPVEQHMRPAIDVLFRSAAEAFGPEVIGVVLTGMLQDGSSGLRAVHDAGGITIVQEPRTAVHGDMPRNAMKDLVVDYCVDLEEIGPLLDLLVRRGGERGDLEGGLAYALRGMRDRLRLLGRLLNSSEENADTHQFLMEETAALEDEIVRLRELLSRAQAPGEGPTLKRG
jgi:two-component system chemotaxis response regulator CheB